MSFSMRAFWAMAIAVQLGGCGEGDKAGDDPSDSGVAQEGDSAGIRPQPGDSDSVSSSEQGPDTSVLADTNMSADTDTSDRGDSTSGDLEPADSEPTDSEPADSDTVEVAPEDSEAAGADTVAMDTGAPDSEASS